MTEHDGQTPGSGQQPPHGEQGAGGDAGSGAMMRAPGEGAAGQPSPEYPARAALPGEPGTPMEPGASAFAAPATDPNAAAMPYSGAAQPTSPTDPFAIVSLATGVLGMGVIPLVFGILSLRRTGPGKRGGHGLALAGTILGGIGLLGWIVVGTLVGIAVHAANVAEDERQATMQEYADGCRDSDMDDCDLLALYADPGTDEEELAHTCNGLGDRDEYITCVLLQLELDTPSAYGDDAELDGFYDACAAGDMTACDDLYDAAPYTQGDSVYRDFGDTCGGTATDAGGTCESSQASAESGSEPTSEEDFTTKLNLMQMLVDAAAPPEQSQNYGDNYLLDSTYDTCAAGDDNACGWLYLTSPEGSGYREFATTCGGRGAQPGVCAP